MGLDLEELMILLQKRCNAMREIKRITGDLLEASLRNDHLTLDLLLRMRAEEMAKAEACWGQIWQLAEQGQEEASAVRRLMSPEFLENSGKHSYEENKVFIIRHKTALLLGQVREANSRLSRRVGIGYRNK